MLCGRGKRHRLTCTGEEAEHDGKDDCPCGVVYRKCAEIEDGASGDTWDDNIEYTEATHDKVGNDSPYGARSIEDC